MRGDRSRLVAVGALAAALFCTLPFVFQIVLSFRGDPDEGGGWSFSSYSAVFRTARFARVLANSLLVAGGTTVACVAIGVLAAFALAYLPVPGKRWLLIGALGISMFPPIATVSPLFLALRTLGLRDSLGALVVPDTTLALPLTLWVLAAFLRELPEDVYEAARVDGCSSWQALRHVVAPLAAPGIATTALLVFVFAWNEFLYALTFLSSPEKRTAPVAIALLTTEHREPWAEIAAASVLVTVPLIALTAWFQRRIVAGLTAGAVKG